MMKVGLGSEVQSGLSAPGATLGKTKPFVAPTTAELASLFPELEILSLIGQGGMGAVYQARQKELDRIVALKILPPGIGQDTAFAERFAREAKALAKLNHPGIVTLYEFGHAGGADAPSAGGTPAPLYYFLMEYVDGVSLRQLLNTGRVSPREALAIVPQICDALQYAHDQGIVHRDIKPENILLDRRGRVKVADFGLAKLIGSSAPLTPSLSPSDGERVAGMPGEGRAPDLTEAGKIMGTPQYMAPEQLEHPGEVDHRADIYALGVVFYQMLTGELPAGKFLPPSRRVQVDVRLDEVVLHALEKEPERRYQQVSQVKSAVETIVQNPPSDPEARVSGRAERTLVPRAVAVSRWTARILGTALLAFYGIFILGEGLPPIGSQPEGVQFGFAALGLMLLGFVVGWKREGTAAILICSGWTLWHISEGRLTMDLFHTPLPVGLLYGYCWWAMHGRRTSVVAGVAAALALAFGLGMLFLPTSVHVSGVVADASTGRPVADAELTLQPLRQPAPGATHIPNARSDQHGRFSLYVGWYAEGKQVAIAAPGYQALQTKLGPRPAGRRRLHRDFQLQPATTAADLDAKIAQLSKSGTTVEEVIHLLGEPQQYRWGKEVFTKDSLPTGYLLQYPRGLQVLVNLGVVVELRSEEPGPGFTWQGKLRLGSTLDEVLQVLGPPSGTVAGKPLTFDPGVLYKDVDGDKGRCYYSRPDQHIRLFFRGYRVCALYLTLMDELNANYKQQGPL
jgi:hypothetical protein